MSQVDDIRRQMALIRHEMHYDVSNVVSDVESVMDWRSIIRRHPYITIGAGLAVGYFLVPRRKPATRTVPLPQALAEISPETLAAVIPPVVEASRKAEKPSKPLSRQLLGWGVGMLWPLVGQSVQAYAAMWLEDQIKQHLNPNPKPPGDRVPPSSSGRPGEPYDGAPATRDARRG
ncbi:hypothetical protein [Paludisphaera rhizosphaerae]|uniref:hypothetical protein n=1 Tax=Paludisphaera rhizosphaerae TaxID=2711216 RepID=UPI0013EB0A83|nr:hypothetical protein [Paludisphaera rhizosphaerae]